jgi:hypothetical protein
MSLDHPTDPVDHSHARHDPLLVAEAADRGGQLPPELAACPDCRRLHVDLLAVSASLPIAALPARPRDYTLTPADAARLRRTGWRSWLAGIGGSRDVVTRPLAIGLTTLGLAGLLVATLPSVLPQAAGTASGPAIEAASPAGGAGAAGAVDTSAPSTATGREVPAAPNVPAGAAIPSSGAGDLAGEADAATSTDETTTRDVTGLIAPSGAPDPAPEAATDKIAALTVRDDPTGISALAVVGGSLLIVGLGLFGLRWSAGRR